jgi:hypothetical protein
MKRSAPLALIVLALALVPAALADDVTAPAQPTAAAAGQTRHAGHVNLKLRLEIVRLRVQIVKLRFRLHCGPNAPAAQERCIEVAQKVEDRLSTFDTNVREKLDELAACTPESSETLCKNGDEKIALLKRIDERVQKALENVQRWLDRQSSGTAAGSALGEAATDLSQAATGANG